MHTDEYEISLSRELDVCRKKVKALQKKLSCMEKKFNISTGEFVKDFKAAKIDTHNNDFVSWFNDFDALGKWQESLRQYEEIFFSLKI
ncbi:MAG: hypothetical protein FIA94_13955 [Nitrospirae bacterium]|nr:hypothetical protein [Nitrospirota bacterium]